MEIPSVYESIETKKIEKTFQHIDISQSRLSCKKDNAQSLFFSTVESRNNLFTSRSTTDLLDFYNSFKNRNQLIKWMAERPKGVANIYEVDGKKDIIIVIPTSDYFGKFARVCREEIFKGAHIIFVESGGRDDYYFNYAHNCNIGFKKAMEYDPKWIVLSGDDMYKIDDISILRKELEKLDHNSTNTVITETALYHSIPSRITEPNSFNNLVAKIVYSFTKKGYFKKIKEQFFEEFFDHQKSPSFKFRLMSFLFSKIIGESLMFEFRQKFKMTKVSRPVYKDKMKLYYKKGGVEFVSLTDFHIYSACFVKKKDNWVFDETFINACEDWDVSLELRNETAKQKGISFRIGDYIGSTLGQKSDRYLRNFAGYIYLNNKIENKA